MSVFKQDNLLVNPLRAAKRGLFITGHVFVAFFIIILLRVMVGRDWYITPIGRSLTHWWMRHLTRILGIRIYQHGSPPEQHAFYVGNHVSFLDILVVLSITSLNFLSKNTVRYWPVVGYIAVAAGTIFIKRGKRHRLGTVVSAITNALQHERSVMVFPEGTTTLGKEPKKFHSGLFQAAIDSQTPVQAVAIRYLTNGELDRVAAYIDNDNLLITLYRIIKRPRTEVHLTFCAPLNPDDLDRTELATQARQQIIDAFSQQWVAS